MTKSLAVVAALTMLGAQASAAELPSLAEYEKCAARIKKDMPIPPANEEAVRLMIQSLCGKKPAK